MKLTKAQLKQLIKEELEVFREGQLWSDDRPAGNDPNFKIIPQEAWIRAALDSGFGYDVANKHYLKKIGYGYRPTFRWKGVDWAGAFYKPYDALSDSGGTFFGRDLLGKAIGYAESMDK